MPDADGDSQETGARIEELQGAGQGTAHPTCAMCNKL
jgi:hypothetical protein